MKLLLTGATGFLGRTFLLDALLANTYSEIYLPVRSIGKLKAQFLEDGFSEVPASVRPFQTSAPQWNLASLPPVDHVVHCAGLLFGRTSHEFQEINVEGTLNLLRNLGGNEKVVLISSQSAAGPCRSGELEKREGVNDSPVTWYGKSKLEMERRVRSELPSLNCLILRPPMILGARDQATLPLFRMARQPIRFKPGFGLKYYSYVAVNDLVSAIRICLKHSNHWQALTQRVFFVASEKPITDRELISLSAQASKRSGIMVSVPQIFLRGVCLVVDRIPQLREAVPSLSRDRAREIWPNRWVISSGAFRSSFPWAPSSELKQTLKETHDWYRDRGQLN